MAIDVEAFTFAEMSVIGQLAVASNATLLVEIEGQRAVYKPIAGEQPLWDFPDHTLALREVAAFEYSNALEWNIVPRTILRDGPYGMGAVQEWIDIDDVDLIALVQSDNHRLAQIALFDALINNTDRKASHLLPKDGEIYGCDHGVTFHEDYKLRTVLWQWRGSEIPEEWLNHIAQLDRMKVSERLTPYLSPSEISALFERTDALLASKTFPQPNPEWPAVPWPPV